MKIDLGFFVAFAIAIAVQSLGETDLERFLLPLVFWILYYKIREDI